MNSVTLFLLACLPARILLAWLSTKFSGKLFGTLLLAMSLGFLWLYFTGGRKYAFETGGPTWWSQYRLIVGLLYLAAAVYSFQGLTQYAWIPIIIDAIFGAVLVAIKNVYK